MKHHQLLSTTDGAILFEGQFQNFKHCLEQAVKDRVTLNNVALNGKNLTNINLDDAIMPGADFTGANLTGANLSEAYLKGANFTASALYNVCFNESNLTACNFTSAAFGATDIHGCIITNAQFSSLSCFTLDFVYAREMGGCIFINPDGRICAMSKPPVVIRGLNHRPIILLDHQVKFGHNVIDHKRLRPWAEKLSMRALKKRLAA